jgi:hypothetical protein
MESNLVVFVSSQIDELLPETQMVTKAVSEIPINRPWVFEHAPASAESLVKSYLPKVRECDIFILLVGKSISDSAKVEYQTAADHDKTRLVFLKNFERSAEAKAFVDRIDVKCAKFSTSEELHQQVQEAVLGELTKEYRLHRLKATELSRRAATAKEKIVVEQERLLRQLRTPATHFVRSGIAAQHREVLDQIATAEKKYSVHRVFMSSTGKGVKESLRQVVDALEQSPAYKVVSLPPNYPIDLRLDEIRRCDMFVGVYKELYGPTFSGLPRLALCELDLRQARQGFRRCLLFLSEASVPQPSLLRTRESSESYPQSGLRSLRRGLSNSLSRTPAPEKQLEKRKRYQYKRTSEHIDLYNHSEEAAYQAMLKLREAASETDSCYGFGDRTELRDNLSDVLEAYQKMELTGLVPSDIQDRWRLWAHSNRRTIEEGMPYPGSQLPSSIEIKEGVWQSFITSAWHDDIRDLCAEVTRLALQLVDEQFMSGTLIQPDRPPDELFGHDYEDMVLDLSSWVQQLREAHTDVWKICDRWRQANEKLRQMIERAESERVAEWEDDLKELAEEVRESALNLLANPQLARVAAAPDPLPGNFFEQEREVIEFELGEWYNRSQSEHEKARTRLKTVFNDWDRATKDLHEAVTKPRFGRCLLVIGREGAGKSQFVARLLDRQVKPFACPLYLGEPRRVENWESFLCEVAKLQEDPADSGPEWRSLEELGLYLSGRTAEEFPPSPLVIIIDGLEDWIRHDPGSLGRLQAFIAKNTQLHNLRWVLTLSESAYHYVVGDERFWARYGSQMADLDTDATDLPGWRSLDDLNEETNIWEPIIEKDRVDVESFDPASRRLLSTPFNAWLVSELELLPQLPKLNFIDLVEEFWSHRLEEMAPVLREQWGEARLQAELKGAVRFIAEQFAKEGKEHFSMQRLPKDLAEWDSNQADWESAPTGLKEEAIAKGILKALKDMGYLIPQSPDPDRIAEEGDVVRLGILPFWQYWGGRALAEHVFEQEYDQDIARTIFRARFGSAPSQPTSATAAGLVEFAILCLDQKAAREESLESKKVADDCLLSLSQLVIAEMNEIRSSVWLAAAKASSAYHRKLGGWLDSESTLPLEKREELHRFMYFLKNARLQMAETDLPPHLRLKLLQPYYSLIGQMGLASYFGNLVGHILADWVGGEEIARSVAYLYGTECFWDARQWGSWAYKKLESLARRNGHTDWDLIMQWMRIVVSEVSQLLTTSEARLASPCQAHERMHEHDRLWAWVVGSFCEAIKDEVGLQGLDWLAENGWFHWSDQATYLAHGVVDATEERTTSVMGKWYRSEANQAEKGDYVDKIEALMQGDGKPKATAILLIYHTVAKDAGQKLDAVALWNLLDALRWDTDLEVEELWQENESLTNFYEEQRRYFQ